MLFQSGDSLQILVTTRASGGQHGGPAAQAGARCSLPAPTRSNFSPMLLRRSCVSPAYSLWTAAKLHFAGDKKQMPPLWGPPLPEHPSPAEASPPSNSRAPHWGWLCPWWLGKAEQQLSGRPHLSFPIPFLLTSWSEPLERASVRKWHQCPALCSLTSGCFKPQANGLKLNQTVSIKCLA